MVSQTRAVTIYMLALALIAAIALTFSPLADWKKWTIGAGVAVMILSIILIQAIQSLRQVLRAIDDGEY